MLTIGLLTPRSQLYPSLGTDWVGGLRSFLRQAGLQDSVKILTENIGFGTDEGMIYSLAEKLVLQEDADIVFLYAEPRVAEIISPLFTASQKLLAVVHTGANFPDNREAAPTTLHLSLQFAYLCGLTGKLAGCQPEKEAINLISFYDGGYRQCFAMLHHHQQEGGVPAFNYVTPLQQSDFSLDPVAGFLAAHPSTKTLLCMASGAEAGTLLTQLAPLQQQYGLRIWGNPMMLAEIPGRKEDEPGAELSGFIPWYPGSDNPGNQFFLQTLSADKGKRPNYFSLLGWECGLLLERIIQTGQDKAATGWVEDLVQTPLNSPRGYLQTDPVTHELHGPAWLGWRRMDGTTGADSVPTDDAADWASYAQFRMPAGESTSWRNTYLCI